MPCPTTSGLPLLGCCGPGVPPGRYAAEAFCPKNGFGLNGIGDTASSVLLPDGVRRYFDVSVAIVNHRGVVGVNPSYSLHGDFFGDVAITGVEPSDWTQHYDRNPPSNELQHPTTGQRESPLWERLSLTELRGTLRVRTNAITTDTLTTITYTWANEVPDDPVEVECQRLLDLLGFIPSMGDPRVARTQFQTSTNGPLVTAWRFTGCRASDGCSKRKILYVPAAPPQGDPPRCIREEIDQGATIYYPIACATGCEVGAPPRYEPYHDIGVFARGSEVRRWLIDVCPP